MSWNNNPTGIFNTSFNPATLNQDSFAGFVVTNYPPGARPLFAMSTMFAPLDRPVVAPEHGYHTEDFMFSSVTINKVGNYAAGDTAIVVDDVSGVVPGMVFGVPATRENVRVTAVNTGTKTLTVERAFGRVAAGVIADDAVLYSVGNAVGEASERPVARSISAVYVPNYTSIFRTAWSLTNTARGTKTTLASYNNLARNKEQCMRFHTLNWEEIFVWSQPQAPSGNPPMHSTQGLIDSIYQHAPANVCTAGATTTFAQMEGYMEKAFAGTSSVSESNKRVALCDRLALKVANHIGRTYPDALNMTSGETTFGTRYTKMQFYAGEVTFVEDKVLNGSAAQGGLMLVVNPEVLRVGYLDGRDAIPEEMNGVEDSISNALDATQGSLLTEMVVQNLVPRDNVIINGLTAAA